LTAFSGSEF